MYDLLIKKGHVVDPAQQLDGPLDIAINQGKIALVARDIPANQGRQLIDAAGKIVTPGLIDIHSHVYAGITYLGAEPDEAGVRQGVTTVVDAGSAGWATLAVSGNTSFRRYRPLFSFSYTLVPSEKAWLPSLMIGPRLTLRLAQLPSRLTLTLSRGSSYG